MNNFDIKKKITIVSPFYNEEEGVIDFFIRIADVYNLLRERYDVEVISVNDGSKDNTLAALISSKENYSFLTIIDLSRNFGKEAAISAGLDYATGDVVILIDSDLQHPPDLIISMIKEWEEGFEVVLAKRNDRSTDHAVQKMTARWFYRIYNKPALFIRTPIRPLNWPMAAIGSLETGQAI